MVQNFNSGLAASGTITAPTGTFTESLTISGVPIGAGGGGTALTIKEVDESPSVANVDTIVVSNGTLTDDGGGQVTISTGGGGGEGGSGTTSGTAQFNTLSGTVWVPAAPPENPSAYDDEFDGSSIKAKWTTWDPGSALTTLDQTTAPGFLSMRVTASDEFFGVYQDSSAIAANNFTVYAKFSVAHRKNASNDEMSFGLIFGEDLDGNPTTADLLFYGITLSDSATPPSTYLGASSLTQYNSALTLLGSFHDELNEFGWNDIYLRARRTAGDDRLHVEYSIDGTTYVSITNFVLSTTNVTSVDQIGIGVREKTSGYPGMLFVHYFRIAPTVGSQFNVLPGRHVSVVTSGTEVPTTGTSSGGGGGAALTVETTTGETSVANVDTIVVASGTLTDDGGGQVTIGGGPLKVWNVDAPPDTSILGGTDLNDEFPHGGLDAKWTEVSAAGDSSVIYTTSSLGLLVSDDDAASDLDWIYQALPNNDDDFTIYCTMECRHRNPTVSDYRQFGVIVGSGIDSAVTNTFFIVGFTSHLRAADSVEKEVGVYSDRYTDSSYDASMNSGGGGAFYQIGETVYFKIGLDQTNRIVQWDTSKDGISWSFGNKKDYSPYVHGVTHVGIAKTDSGSTLESRWGVEHFRVVSGTSSMSAPYPGNFVTISGITTPYN